MRKWHKTIPPKKAQEMLNIYRGTWNPQLDRCWESDDGYCVMSRLIQTDWGKVEHVTIERFGCLGRGGDIPWAVKQEIKTELFGRRCTAIEVFPCEKNLIDVCDIYHLWILPEKFKLPFGIHPYRDPQCEPVERGYDFNLADCQAWLESPERKAIMGRVEDEISSNPNDPSVLELNRVREAINERLE